MLKNKLGLAKKIVEGSIVLGSILTPVVLNGQNTVDMQKVQKGVNAGIFMGENDSHVIYHFNFNKDLKKAVTNSAKPNVYLMGNSTGSYIEVDSDFSGYSLYYPKKNFDENGDGKVIGVTVRGDEHVSPCDPNGLGSKTNSLASFYWAPSQEDFNKQSQLVDSIPDGFSQRGQGDITVFEDNRIINKTTNNYYGDTSRVEIPRDLEFRVLTDISKLLNSNKPINSPFWELSVNPQLGIGSLWFGPYAIFGFGAEKKSFSTPVYKKTLLNQNLQLYSETEGNRIGTSTQNYPLGFGGAFSLNTKDNRVRLDLYWGIMNELNLTSDINESGEDRIIQNGKIVDEKPYGPINIENGVKYKKWNSNQRIGLAVEPFKKFPVYGKLEAQNIGKLGSNENRVLFNVKVGGRFGGGKRGKK